MGRVWVQTWQLEQTHKTPSYLLYPWSQSVPEKSQKTHDLKWEARISKLREISIWRSKSILQFLDDKTLYIKTSLLESNSSSLGLKGPKTFLKIAEMVLKARELAL